MRMRVGGTGLSSFMLAALVALGIGCGGSGQEQPGQASRSNDRPSEGFQGRDGRDHLATPKPPAGSVTDGGFVNGERYFYIFKDTQNGNRLYAGALYLPTASLGPNYTPGAFPYIAEDGSFSLKGDWMDAARRRTPGTATGKVAADNQSVTVSWPSNLPAVYEGKDVVFRRP